jgi:hypothetical protein
MSNIVARLSAGAVALVALYNSANGERWTKNTGWATDTDPCGWFGIACTAAALTN